MDHCLLRLIRPAAFAAVFFLTAPAWAQLVINEVDYDQGATDDAEFIEILNTGGSSVEVTAFTVVLSDQSGSSTTIVLNSTSIAAGDYYVICADSANVSPCDQVESAGFIDDGPDGSIGLRDDGDVLLDGVGYEGDAGAFVETAGATGEDGTVPGAGISRVPDGTDTDDNSADFQLSCVTPGAANVAEDSNCLCGDGNVDAGEECDEGADNGTAASCCTSSCQFKTEGAACGDGTDTACTAPDTCDGAGTCLANDEPDDTLCDDGDGNDCTGVCTSGACTTDPRPVDTACGDPTDDTCTAPDTCDGAGTCLANDEADDTFCDDGDGNDCTGVCTSGACTTDPRPVDTACGDPTDDTCTNPDTCDGSGTCLANDEADDTFCDDGDGNDCTGVCTSGACTTDPRPTATPCGDPTDTTCTNPDSCDGSGSCLPNHAGDGTFCDDGDQSDCTGLCASGSCAGDDRPEGTACGDPTDTDCDGADTCDGSGSCLANLAEDGTACADDDAFCTGAESCLGGACVSEGDPCDPDNETCDEDEDVCVRPDCGDGVVEGDEECDDFNFEAGDGCDECEIELGWVCGDADDDGISDCFETCGDGVVDDFESCDDGDLESGDGCSEGCQIESGWECTSDDAGDICRPVCGDGFTRPGEECDDGNSEAGDGCSECRVESGYVCDRQSPSVCAVEDAAGGGCRAAGEGGGAPLALLLLAAAFVLRRRRR